MLVFLDESFRNHLHTKQRLGVLAGIAIPEDAYASIFTDLYQVRRPYHGEVLNEGDEVKGKELLRNMTFRSMETKGYSYHWNLAKELLQLARTRRLRIFGVVCFRTRLHSFVCDDETRLDVTYRYLFERIDNYMKDQFPVRKAKLVFDDRDVIANQKNARAITNFFVRSTLGLSYDSILRTPFFAVSQGHCYGLQLADLVTTVIAMRFQGDRRVDELWAVVQQMLHRKSIGGVDFSSLKVMREWPESPLNEKEVRRPEGL